MTDLIEQRLIRTARHWQETQPTPPVVPLDRLAEHPARPGRRGRVALAAAAAVLVVAAGAVAVSRLASSGTSPSPTGPVTHRVGREHPGTVPWADLPAGHPHVRTTLPPSGGATRGRVVTPYDRVSAVGAITGRARPGDVLVFEADLLSSTDLPLDPCPDYSIAFGRDSFRTWRLNCSAVPYRDARGRPYLPASTNVRFEMRVTVPDEPGTQKVLWALDGPQSMPGFYGLVHVVRTR
jgi:hypothetical protein